MRIKLRLPFIIMAVVCVLLFIALPIAIGVVVLLFAPPHVGIPVALGAVAFSALMSWAMSSSYHWIEVQGDVIRGRKLLTRRIVERRVDEIVRILPLHSRGMSELENAILDSLLKTSNRGYSLLFCDGQKIGLVRGDMAGLNDFLLVLHDRLGERWDVVTDCS
jgi:hypothetical protein